MTYQVVEDYFEDNDPMRPDLNRKQLKPMTRPQLLQVIEVQGDRWNMPLPDTKKNTKAALLKVIDGMAKKARELGL